MIPRPFSVSKKHPVKERTKKPSPFQGEGGTAVGRDG